MLRSTSFLIKGEFNTRITISENLDGTLTFKVEVEDGATIGDLRALFFDFNSEVEKDSLTLLNDLSDEGDVLDIDSGEASLSTLGQDANVNGEIIKEDGKFDAGVEFGTSGMSGDDIQEATFTIGTVDGSALSLDDLSMTDFAVRYTSVGAVDGLRDESLKLSSSSGDVAANDVIDILEDTPSVTVDLIEGPGSDLDEGNLVRPDVVAVGDLAGAFSFDAVNETFKRTFAFTDPLGNSLELGTITVGVDGNAIFVTDGADIDRLAKDEDAVLEFSYTTSPDGDTFSTAIVTLTVTGQNDAPRISLGASGSAEATVAETDAALTASGDLTVFDVDITDTVVVEVTEVSTSGDDSDDATPDNVTLLTFMTIPQAQPVISDFADTAGFTWSFDSLSETFDYLGVGDSLILTYTIKATDEHGASDLKDVVVTITGTNDAPEVTATTKVSDTVDETEGHLTTSGSFDIRDVDSSDIVVVANVAVVASGVISGVDDNATLLSFFSTDANPQIAAGDNAGTVNWTFNAGTDAFDHLAAGEALILTYTLSIADDNAPAGSATQDIVIMVNGTNDAPVIGSGDLTGDVVEGDTSFTLIETGTIAFTDADFSDSHTAPTPQFVSSTHTEQLGGMRTGIVTQTDSTGQGGVVTWAYNVLDSRVQFLAEGETITEVYRIFVADDFASDFEDVAVTITGTNDAPTLLGAAVRSLSEDAAPTLTDSDSFIFTDVDLSDAHTISTSRGATSVSPGAAAPTATLAALDAAFSATIVDASTGDGAGVADWSFSLSNADVEFLALGETLSVSYDVVVNDGLTNSNVEILTVEIAGQNDDPELFVATGDEVLIELDEANTPISDAKTLSVRDVDVSDQVTVTVDDVRVTGDADGLTTAELLSFLSVAPSPALGSGATSAQFTYQFDSLTETFAHLVKDEQLVLAYTLTARDGNGGVDTFDVTVEITGVNEAPRIFVDALAGDDATKNAAESDVGIFRQDTLTVEDFDPNDPVAASIVGVSTTGPDGGAPDDATLLSFFSISPTAILPAGTDSAQLTYTFDSGDEAFDYLQDGDRLSIIYTIQVTDSFGEVDTQTVRINVNGRNDAPDLRPYTLEVADPLNGGTQTITVANTANVLETDSALTSSGFLLLDDADDTVFTTSIRLDGVPALIDENGVDTMSNLADFIGTRAEAEGFFSVNAPFNVAGLGQVVTWNFDSGTNAFDFLAAGDTVTLDYEVTVDDGAATDTETVTITVVGTDDAPVAVNDVATTTEDQGVIIDVLQNDFDLDRNETPSLLRIFDVETAPFITQKTAAFANNGDVFTNSSGNLFYAPDDHFSGTDTISYLITDGDTPVVGEVDVTVAAVADTPDVAINLTEGASTTQVIATVQYASADLDGSETFSLAVSGAPTGTTINQISDTGAVAVYQIDLQDATTSFVFEAISTSTEASNGDTAVGFETVKVEAFPVTNSFRGNIQLSGSEALFGPNAQPVTNTTFLGIDIDESFTRGGKTGDVFDLSTRLELKTGFESDFELTAGTVDANLAPLSLDFDTAYTVADDLLTLTPTALFDFRGGTISTTGPELNYDFSAIFDALLDVDLDVLDATIIPNAVEVDVDVKESLFNYASASGETAEIDILGLATAFLSFPVLETFGFDLSPTSDVITSSGKSTDVLKLEVDLDAIAAKIGRLPVNPYDLSFDTTVLGTDIAVTADLLDVDAVTSVNFLQDFTFDPGDISAELFLDGVSVATNLDLQSDIVVMDALSTYDVGQDGEIRVDFVIDVVNSEFTNDTDLAFDVGIEVDALEFGIEGEFGTVTLFDESIGPLFGTGIETEVASIDIFDKTFDIDIDAQTFGFDLLLA